MAQEVNTATKPDAQEGALVRRLDPQALIEKALDGNQTIEVLERLFQLAKDVRAEQAREAWNVAMARFQRECPKIIKTRTADAGRYTYRYSPLDAIMPKILPKLGEVGLSVAWRQSVQLEQNRVLASCRITHEMGHFEESGEIFMPVNPGDAHQKMGASDPQRVGIAMTYARRYSLMAILGLAPEDDPDAAPANGGTSTQMPRRASDSQAPPPPTVERYEWIGMVQNVISKSGSTGGKPWNLYVIKGSDGFEATTFDDKTAEFARNRGKKLVSILWEPTAKGKKILSIEAGPEPEPEPGERE